MNNQKLFYYFIFALSGFSALIYESIWTKYLKSFLGHASYAQSLVLIAMMGGMALGAWLSAQSVDHEKKPLLKYAKIEFCLGVMGLAFHPAYLLLENWTYNLIIPNLSNIFIIQWFKYFLAFFLIIPQCILLGCTFPLFSLSLVRTQSEDRGSILCFLYFSNSIGGALGVLLCGFIFIELFGLPGSLYIAAITNLTISLISFVLTFENKKQKLYITKKPSTTMQNKLNYILIAISFITGCASFMYEIAWVRMLSMVNGSSTHSFEIMLSAFILGLAFGGLWIKKSIHKFKNSIELIAIIQIIMGTLAISSLLLYDYTFEIMTWLFKNINRDFSGYLSFNIIRYLISLFIMFPVTFCAGMILPLITYILLERNYGEKAIGYTYASNTLGAILGVILATHVIMPLFSLKMVILLGSLIDISATFMILYFFFKKEKIYILI